MNWLTVIGDTYLKGNPLGAILLDGKDAAFGNMPVQLPCPFCTKISNTSVPPAELGLSWLSEDADIRHEKSRDWR